MPRAESHPRPEAEIPTGGKPDPRRLAFLLRRALAAPPPGQAGTSHPPASDVLES